MKPVNIPKIHKILSEEFKKFPAPVVDLIQIQTKDPFKVLVATILSARTGDATTVNACKKLFKKVNSYGDLERISVKDIEKLIYPVGFYHTKADHLKQLPLVLEKEFGGKVPDKIDSLLKLPGVGRKTANLVVAIAFNKPALAVDVHCHRIPQRLGWFKSKTPHETEGKLKKLVPKRLWKSFNSIFVSFGQNTCRPVSPHCWDCPITKYCRYYKMDYLTSTKVKPKL